MSKDKFFGLSVVYLIIFASMILIGLKPVTYFDSARYFLIDDQNFLRNELWSHSGSYLQTIFFSIGDSPQSALNSNLFMWLVSSIMILFIIRRNIIEDGQSKLHMVITLALVSSNIVVGWIVGILSESMGISFLFATLVPTILIFLKVAEKDKFIYSVVLINFCLLAASKPLWAVLISPIIIALVASIQKRIAIAIGIVGIAVVSSFVVLKSADRPYDNTGLTYNGWHSLMRAYSLSLPERFGPVALGNIPKCDEVYSQVIDARTKGTPSKLYFEFPTFAKSCPWIIDDLNSGKSNSPVKLIFNDLSATRTVFVNSLFAITRAPANGFDESPIGIFGLIVTSLIYPISIMLIPISLLMSWQNRELLKKLLFLYVLGIGGSFLIYIQDGIEMERHMIPMTFLLSLTSIFSIVANMQTNKTKV